MNSLQKPRKIKIRGSDGHNYTFLCKPRDDLRKDARLMEFNNMINRFLKKDLEASRRTLSELLLEYEYTLGTDKPRYQDVSCYTVERGVWFDRMG